MVFIFIFISYLTLVLFLFPRIFIITIITNYLLVLLFFYFILFYLNCLLIQVIPSTRPSPVVAQDDLTCQVTFLSFCSSSLSMISSSSSAFGRSLLFAKTRTTTSFMSGSVTILNSSSRASSILSWSALSTT